MQIYWRNTDGDILEDWDHFGMQIEAIRIERAASLSSISMGKRMLAVATFLIAENWTNVSTLENWKTTPQTLPSPFPVVDATFAIFRCSVRIEWVGQC